MAVSAPERSMLKRLDDRVVPRLQRGVRALLRGATWPARQLRRLDNAVGAGRLARAVTEHRAQVAFLVVAVGFAATAVHAQRYPHLRQAEQIVSVPGSVADDRGPSSGLDSGEAGATVVGPRVGAQVPDYLGARQAVLDGLDPGADVGAVVSFSQLLTPSAVESLVSSFEDAGLAVHSVQYRLPERDPIPARIDVRDNDIAGSVETALRSLVDALREEERQVASTLESGVEDEEFRRDYETRLEELRSVRNVLTTDPAVLFAVVVEGRAGALMELAEDSSVRLVDPAPPGADVASTTFYGILPADDERFTYGHHG